MAHIDDLRRNLAYLEESDANKDAADALRAEIAAEQAAADRPAKKPRTRKPRS